MNLKNRNIITISIFERIEFTMNKDIISIDIDNRGFKSILESMPGGRVVSIVFFVAVFFAGLSSLIIYMRHLLPRYKKN